MMQPQRFRKKPVEIDAIRWDRTDETAEALWEWTNHVVATNADGSPHMTSVQFMVLQDWANSDAEETFGQEEEQRRIDEGYTAVIYDRLHGTWVNVAENDWIIKGVDGEFYPCKPDVFDRTYESVIADAAEPKEAAAAMRELAEGGTGQDDDRHEADA